MRTAIAIAIAGLALTAVVLGSIAAAATPDPAPATTPTPAPSPSLSIGLPDDGGFHGGTSEIARILEAVGVPCTDYTLILRPTDARQRAHCQDGSVVLSVYDGPADVVGHLYDHRELNRTAGLGTQMLFGRNWTINADDEKVLHTARGVLGGRLLIEE